jgi:hypothetical protein
VTVKVISEQQVLHEAVGVLMEHMSPAKVARFLAAWQVDGGDYLTIRRQLFAGETVKTLSDKIKAHSESGESRSAAAE